MKRKIKDKIQDMVKKAQEEGKKVADVSKDIDIGKETEIDDEGIDDDKEEPENEEEPDEEEPLEENKEDSEEPATPVVQVPVLLTRSDLDKMIYNTHSMVQELYSNVIGILKDADKSGK